MFEELSYELTEIDGCAKAQMQIQNLVQGHYSKFHFDLYAYTKV